MINTNKNVDIRITLRKADAERLEIIKSEIENELTITLTKSQVIGFLIRNFSIQADKKTPMQKATEQRLKRAQAHKISGVNYGDLVRKLKDALNVSYTRLSEILSIPSPTLKKYASGKQQPTNENLQLLNDALKKYGIK